MDEEEKPIIVGTQADADKRAAEKARRIIEKNDKKPREKQHKGDLIAKLFSFARADGMSPEEAVKAVLENLPKDLEE